MSTANLSVLSIDGLLERLQSRSKLHAGYPYNLAFDSHRVLPLLKYTLNNLGDAYVEGNYGINTKDFEREIISFFADIYHLEKDDAWGYVTSCGTEGNLYGILMGRELYPDGILYGSADCHYSVVKAARMFRIPFVEIKSQIHGEIDYSSLHEALDKNRDKPAIINVNVGTTITGAVDDISKVVAILSELNISQFHIHVDGALGGMLIPYMQEATPLDFSRYPIGSIAVSGHKFIGSPVPCGVVLARKEKVQSFDIEYLGSTDTTITGSRNGLTPVILWDAIKQRKHLFKEEVLNCRRLAEYFWNKIAESRKFALINPFSTTVVFERPEKFIEKRWQLACYGKIAHIVVMQNHNQAILEQLLQELGVMNT